MPKPFRSENALQMYCRSCGYDLTGSAENCPECNTVFRPDEPITFDKQPPPHAVTSACSAFAATLVGSGILAIVIFFVSNFVDEQWHEELLLVAGVALLLIQIISPLRLMHLPQLAGSSFGLTWGFLFALSVAVSIQNGRVSIHWPAFLPALLILPLAAFLLSTPFLFMRRWLRRRRIRGILAHPMT